MGGLESVSEHLSGLPLAAALAGLGLVVGVLTGLFGVGGAFLVTPLLKVLFGIDYRVAVASGLCFTIGSSAAGASRHLRLQNVEWRSTGLMAIGAVTGAVGGACLNDLLEHRFGTGESETYTLIMDGLYIVLLAATAAMLLRPSATERTGPSLLQRVRLGPRIDLRSAELVGVSIAGVVAVGLIIGLMKGLMGIGGGIFLMPLLVLVVGLRPHLAVGTSLGVVVFSSIAGTVKYGLAGDVNLWVAMALLVGSTVGIQIGAWVCSKIGGRRLTRYFVILVLAVVAMLLVDLVRTAGG